MVSVFHYRSWAQQNLNVSGQSVKINGLHFDYSIGEMTLISTQSNSKITVTQGILQPTIPVTKMPNQQGSSATLSETNIKVYPNPTENMLFIESFENEDAELSFQLYDLSGRVIYTEKNEQKCRQQQTFNQPQDIRCRYLLSDTSQKECQQSGGKFLI